MLNFLLITLIILFIICMFSMCNNATKDVDIIIREHFKEKRRTQRRIDNLEKKAFKDSLERRLKLNKDNYDDTI